MYKAKTEKRNEWRPKIEGLALAMSKLRPKSRRGFDLEKLTSTTEEGNLL